MSKSPSRHFPVTTQLPVTRCQICHRTVAYRPGNLTEVLTEHYRRAHPEALDLASQ
jgi:BED zinc finger